LDLKTWEFRPCRIYINTDFKRCELGRGRFDNINPYGNVVDQTSPFTNDTGESARAASTEPNDSKAFDVLGQRVRSSLYKQANRVLKERRSLSRN
jgi:hypothetical protein